MHQRQRLTLLKFLSQLTEFRPRRRTRLNYRLIKRLDV